jgi:hypothetical protein
MRLKIGQIGRNWTVHRRLRPDSEALVLTSSDGNMLLIDTYRRCVVNHDERLDVWPTVPARLSQGAVDRLLEAEEKGEPYHTAFARSSRN